MVDIQKTTQELCRMNMMKNILNIGVIALFFIIVGGILWSMTKRSSNYIMIIGKIKSGDVRIMPNRKTGKYYIDYDVEYIVNNKSYNYRVSESTWHTDKMLASMQMTNMIGKDYKIYYDPENPENSINNKSKSASYITIFFGLIFIAYGYNVYKKIDSICSNSNIMSNIQSLMIKV